MDRSVDSVGTVNPGASGGTRLRDLVEKKSTKIKYMYNGYYPRSEDRGWCKPTSRQAGVNDNVAGVQYFVHSRLVGLSTVTTSCYYYWDGGSRRLRWARRLAELSHTHAIQRWRRAPAEKGRRLLSSGMANNNPGSAAGGPSLGLDRRFRGLKPRARAELPAAPPAQGGMSKRELYELKKADRKAQQTDGAREPQQQ